MGVKLNLTYNGDFQTEITHVPSSFQINTDLPVDNGGQGRMFSPTDLFAASLGSCILTIMASVAERNKIDFKGTKIEIEKIMADNPRRIGEVKVKLIFVTELDEIQKKKLMACVNSCPVHRSLHPDVKVTVTL